MDTCLEWVNVKCKFFYFYGEKNGCETSCKE